MKRIDLFSIASAIWLISTAAFAQVFPNFDVGKAMEIAGQKVFADRCAVCHAQKVGARPLDGGQSARLDRRSIAHGRGHTHAARIAQ